MRERERVFRLERRRRATGPQPPTRPAPISAFSHLRSPPVGLAPCDLLLLMASAENDAPKVAELLRAGADTGVKVRGRRGER